MKRLFVVWMVASVGGACSDNGSDCTPGSERCACRDDGSCDVGLICAGSCVVRVSGGDSTAGGDPVPGDPMNGDPLSGDPLSGDPINGDPLSGDPTSGDPTSGDPTSGDPMSGDPMSGDPMSGDPMSPGDPMPSTGSVSFSWTVEGGAPPGACPDPSSVVIAASAGPSSFSQSLVCTAGSLQANNLLPGSYTFVFVLLDTVLDSIGPERNVNVVAGQVATAATVDFRWRGRPIECDWTGARWLSHGLDGGAYVSIGAWVTCTSGSVAYMQWVENGTPGVTPSASGTAHVQVGCNWTGDRWASQGVDGNAAFTEGSTVTCTDGQVTSMSWEGDTVGAGTAQSGDLGCNWTGARFLSHGWDGGCAFDAGINVTCFQNLITDVRWVEGGCGRAR